MSVGVSVSVTCTCPVGVSVSIMCSLSSVRVYRCPFSLGCALAAELVPGVSSALVLTWPGVTMSVDGWLCVPSASDRWRNVEAPPDEVSWQVSGRLWENRGCEYRRFSMFGNGFWWDESVVWSRGELDSDGSSLILSLFTCWCCWLFWWFSVHFWPCSFNNLLGLLM